MTTKFSIFTTKLGLNFQFSNSQRGQSLFEVIFAIAITGLLITGIVSLSAKSVRNSDYAKHTTIATKYATEGMEWIRQYRDTDWDLFKAKSSAGGSRWCLNTLTPPTSSSCGVSKIGTTVFWREIILTSDAGNPDVVNVVVEVYWSDSSGTHAVRTDSDFTKWRI